MLGLLERQEFYFSVVRLFIIYFLLSFYKLATQPTMSKEVVQNIQLFVFTKDYAEQRLSNAITRPLTEFFRHLWDLALQDAKVEKKEGPRKREIMYQRRLLRIKTYTSTQINSIVNSILRDYDSLETLLHTIIITNGAIMGAFAREKSKVQQKISIPTNTEFIYSVIVQIGSILYADPLILEDRDATKSATEEGIMRTIHQSFPFEDIIGPLVTSHRFYVDTEQGGKFAENILGKVGQMDPSQVAEITSQQAHGEYDRAPVDDVEYGGDDNMVADDGVDSDDLGFAE